MEIFLRCDSDMSEKRPNYDLDVTEMSVRCDFSMSMI